MAYFEARGITKFFGGLAAVNGVSFKVEQGQIYGLIGPNGSGKTTIFNLINSYFPLTKGSIHFEGKRISGLKTYQICRRGVGRTFQVVKPLTMSLLQRFFMLAAKLRPWKRPKQPSNSAS